MQLEPSPSRSIPVHLYLSTLTRYPPTIIVRKYEQIHVDPCPWVHPDFPAVIDAAADVVADAVAAGAAGVVAEPGSVPVPELEPAAPAHFLHHDPSVLAQDTCACWAP